MFYLTTHSTHFIYGYNLWRQTYGIKDHSDSERGNPLPFPISSKGSFICFPTDRVIHTTGFVTPVVEHCLEQLLIGVNVLYKNYKDKIAM